MASLGQIRMHSPQPMHFSGSICAFSSTIAMAVWEQWGRHSSQATQRLRLTLGLTVECWASLPLREAHPMPRFFRAPPNPESSCPLKWATETRASASTISLPMYTSLKFLRPTFTAVSDLPRRPSAMTRGASTTE